MSYRAVNSDTPSRFMMLYDFGLKLRELLHGRIKDLGHPATYLLRVVRTNALRAGDADPSVADTASVIAEAPLLSRV